MKRQVNVVFRIIPLIAMIATMLLVPPARAASPAQASPALLAARPAEVVAPTPPAAMTANVRITAAGFEPANVAVDVGGVVRWQNTTTAPQTVASGTPTGGGQRVYLPLVLKATAAGGGASGASAQPQAEVTFRHTILPGATFAYTFTTVGDVPFFLVERPAVTGRVTVEQPAPDTTPNEPLPLWDTTLPIYTGDDPIQKGVDPDTIDPQRITVLRGSVTDRARAPLADVRISVLDRPEFGHTRTRADGTFDMVINGGGQIVLDFQRSSFLPVQRTLDTPWQQFVIVDPVVLTPLDRNATSINLGGSGISVARGSLQEDADGKRQSTLLFEGGTRATLRLPNGTTRPLSTLTVRATEYTVGESGPNAMPGTLPAASGYTYAVEFSVDQVLAANATSVEFSKPVINYTENFIGAPVGSPVPAGYYDRTQGRWIAAPDGRVIAVVGETGGRAQVDINGDGAADGAAALAVLGIDEAELRQLATLYNAPAELWRVPIDHFTPWDLNWPFGPPPDADAPTPNIDDIEETNACEAAGSIIGCETQTLGEVLPLSGTPYNLVYQSDRVPGWEVGNTLDIQLTGPRLHPDLTGIRLQIEVAGRRWEYMWENVANPRVRPSPTPDVQPNQSFPFAWDGLDAYGNQVQGRPMAVVRVAYAYPFRYYAARDVLERSFGQFGDNTDVFDGRGYCGTLTFLCGPLVQTTVTRPLGAWNAAQAVGLGGWTLNVHHSYDPGERVLYRGDGTKRSTAELGATVRTVAGDAFGTPFPAAEGGPARAALMDYIVDFALGRDGTLYIIDVFNGDAIRKVDPNGTITTIGGNGESNAEPSGDGGPALGAGLGRDLTAIEVGPDGSVYFTTSDNAGLGYIRRIAPSGIISTIAGTKDRTSTTFDDGHPATATRFGTLQDVKVGPDGAIYFGDRGGWRFPSIRRINLDGRVQTIAGGGRDLANDEDLGDGEPALDAALQRPYGMDFGADGSLYFADPLRRTVQKISTSGILTRVAGTGGGANYGNGGYALQANIGNPVSVAIGPDGAVYIRTDDWNGRALIRKVDPNGIITGYAGVDGDGYCSGSASEDDEFIQQSCIQNNSRGLEMAPDGNLLYSDGRYQVRRVTAPLPGFGSSTLFVPSDDGKELYSFSGRGRHLRTVDALTGALRYEFGYDGTGMLTTIRDGDGNVTLIERTNGRPVALVSPYGQRTALELDATGFLGALANPAGERTTFTYRTGGLLATMTDGRGGRYQFTYDVLGRLVRDQGPAQQVQTLARVQASDAITVTLTNTEGHTTVFASTVLTTGDRLRTVREQDGMTSKLLIRTDGTRTITDRTGTVITTTLGADPRWGLRAPVAASTVVRTPAGKESMTKVTRTTTLRDPNDPLSVAAWQETTEVEEVDAWPSRTTKLAYDGAARTLTHTSPENRDRILTLDERGRIVKEEIEGLAAVAYRYDGRGRLVAATQGDRTTTLAYNAAGWLQTMTDAVQQQTHYTYDAAGRVLTQTLPDGSVNRYSYDRNGNIATIAPPGRDEHAYAYNPVNLPTSYTPPTVGTGSQAWGWTYNPDGQRTRFTTSDGRTASYTYTGGRLSTITIPGGKVTYTYDAATGNLRTLAAQHGATVGYTFDGALPLSETWSGSVVGAVRYAYDGTGRTTGVSVNNDAIAYEYDDDDLPVAAGDLALDYDSRSGLLERAALGGVETAWTQNDFGEVSGTTTSVDGDDLHTVAYSRDALGRITEIAETVGGTTTRTAYRYDATGQLVEVRVNGIVAATYTYDANGNRLTATGAGGTQRGTYDAQDRLSTYGGTTYTYAASGERLTARTGNQTTAYDYDLLGNLRSVRQPNGTTITYTVDGWNRRIARASNGTRTHGWLYGDALNPIAELNARNQVVARFVYASRSNIPDYMIKGGATYRIVTDHLGSPRLVVNVATGQVAQRMDYDAWGTVVRDTNPGFQPFGFAGGMYDRDTGLLRFGARDYDPRTGRWTAKDPIGFAGGDTNLYGYVGNDPVNVIDPTGLEPNMSVEPAPANYSTMVGIHTFQPGQVNGTACSCDMLDLQMELMYREIHYYNREIDRIFNLPISEKEFLEATDYMDKQRRHLRWKLGEIKKTYPGRCFQIDPNRPRVDPKGFVASGVGIRA